MARRNIKKKFNKSKNRIPKKTSLFVNGGLLSDWNKFPSSQGKRKNSNNSGNRLNNSKNKSAARFEIGSSSIGKSKASRILDSQKPKMKDFASRFPQVGQLPNKGGDEHNMFEEPHPVVLVDTNESKIVAYVDNTPVIDSETIKYTYNYSASFEIDDSCCHIGLGFHDEVEVHPSVTNASPFMENKKSSGFGYLDIEGSLSSEENSGFLSIGGMKLYTGDITCNEDDVDNESIDCSESEGSFESYDSDRMYHGEIDFDDEIAKDYFEGIGRSFEVANVDKLVGNVFHSSDDEDDDVSGGCVHETLKRLGGFALRKWSREYGMKKPCLRRKSQPKLRDVGAAKLSHSWPSKAEKKKKFSRFSDEKKKQRQDMTALKRRKRMILRGIDLHQINLKLEEMVQNGGDIMSFQLMHYRDCSQVQRLAAIYHMQSGSQGSGRKRFVTVTRTEHTGMPSSDERFRLDKLLQAVNDEADFTKVSKGASGLCPLDSKSAKSKTKRREKDKTGSYAAQPVSFISSGTITSNNPMDQTLNEDKPIACSSSYGAFELHTKGFGSRMMTKMGYVDGGGLGKDGRGIAEPIEVTQRPKSLGLGAMVPINSTTPQRFKGPVGQSCKGSKSKGKSGNAGFGSFERHTKGFGSKMMSKMGFVEGMGLGRDSQGIYSPLRPAGFLSLEAWVPNDSFVIS